MLPYKNGYLSTVCCDIAFNKNLKKGLVFLKQCGIIIDVMYDVMLYESGVMSQCIKYDNSRII